MQYRVPQFIDMEDKIFMSLTLKQFIYTAGGIALSVALWLYLPRFAALLIITPLLAFSFALAFYKINSRPFPLVLESAFNYFVRPKLYIWKKRKIKKQIKQPSTIKQLDQQQTQPKMTPGKLKELAWSLDINENVYLSRLKHHTDKDLNSQLHLEV